MRWKDCCLSSKTFRVLHAVSSDTGKFQNLTNQHLNISSSLFHCNISEILLDVRSGGHIGDQIGSTLAANPDRKSHRFVSLLSTENNGIALWNVTNVTVEGWTISFLFCWKCLSWKSLSVPVRNYNINYVHAAYINKMNGREDWAKLTLLLFHWPCFRNETMWC